jgi:SHS family lactate transporter-like MFS transporter
LQAGRNRQARAARLGYHLAHMSALPAPVSPQPWYRQVSSDQWRAFVAAYLGWMLDGFDFTILTFLLVEIQRTFTVNSALAGALGTATLLLRVVGGVGAGTAADRWGRKGPLMFSIVWYSLFAFVSGFSTSYLMLFVCRALFGIGMGGVWAAGMPLALEHWPARLRGIASGLLQGGYPFGFILSALVYQLGYPFVSRHIDEGWRVMLWIGVLPALLVLWIARSVKESPVWLERQREAQRAGTPLARFSLARLFERDLRVTTLHTSLVMAAFLFMYQAVSFWYPTLLVRMGRDTLPYLFAFNAGAVAGNVICGRLSETPLGRRGAGSLATLVGLLALPLFAFSDSTPSLLIGATLVGAFGTGNFGIVPTYLNERFPTAVRAGGAGLAYHAGAAVSSVAPSIVGGLVDTGLGLATAMVWCSLVSGIALIIVIWLGPETRGRTLSGS